MTRLSNSTNGYSASNYQVSTVPGQGNFDTIQNAINQAVTDGASSTTPFTVWIQSGLYTEDLTLAPWVNLAGSADSSSNSGVTITGNAVYPDPSVGNLSITNIGFTTANFSPALSFQSTGTSLIHMEAVSIDASTSTGLEVTGSGMTVQVNSGAIKASSGGVCKNVSDGTLEFFSGLVVFTDTPSTISGGICRITGGDIQDSFTVNGGFLQIFTTVIQSGTLPIVELGASGAALLVNCSVSTSNTYVATGTGSFFYSNLLPFQGNITLDPGLTLNAFPTLAGNVYANSLIPGYATTATAAGTTTLTLNSPELQYFTGTTTQDVVLPVTSTLVLGQSFTIVNLSSGIVTVQSSGANTIQAMDPNTTLVVTCILTSGTTAASWFANYSGSAGGSVTFTGDVGTPFTTNAVTIAGDPTANRAGGSVVFRATSPELRLEFTNGSLSTFLGRSAGNNTPFGSANCVAVGYSSQISTATGAANCSLGNSTLANLNSGAYNLALGDQTGAQYGSTESNNILLNCFLNAVAGQNNMLRIGDGTGTGQQQLSTAYICGVSNATLSSGAPTPYLTLTDTSSDQVVCLTPVPANTASTTFGSLAVGTALQNTATYPILVNVSVVATVATGAVILVGVDNNATPTAQAVTATFTGAGTHNFSFVVPSTYYAQVTTTGTITVGSITTFATQIG